MRLAANAQKKKKSRGTSTNSLTISNLNASRADDGTTQVDRSIIIIIVESLWVDCLANGECVLASSDGFFLAFEQATDVRYVLRQGGTRATTKIRLETQNL